MSQVYDPPIEWDGKINSPLILFRSSVRPEWIDEFGHVNHISYLSICDHADWAFWNWINYPAGTMEARDGHENVVVEKHVRYLRELTNGTPTHLETRLIAFDEKRYVLFHDIWNNGSQVLAATVETKFLGFNLNERRAEQWSPIVRERLKMIAEAQASDKKPNASGTGIALAAG